MNEQMMKNSFDPILDAANDNSGGWDIIVVDGTWAQARKLFSRYLPDEGEGGPRRVQLSDQALERLQSSTEYGSRNPGYQLRRHSVAWRQIGTFEATRLFLRDLFTGVGSDVPTGEGRFWDDIEAYQEIANQAARRELGPPRTR